MGGIKIPKTKTAKIKTAATKIARIKIIPDSMTTIGKFLAIGTINIETAHPQGSGIAIDYDLNMNPGFARDMSLIGTCEEWSTRFQLTSIAVYPFRRAATVISSSADT